MLRGAFGFKSTLTAMFGAVTGLLIGILPAMAGDFEKGNQLYARGQFKEAVDAYIGSVCENPKAYAPHYQLANCYMKLGKHADAQTEYEMALDLYPDAKTKANCKKALAYLGDSNPSFDGGTAQMMTDNSLAEEGRRRVEKTQQAVSQEKSRILRDAERRAAFAKENAKANLEQIKEQSNWYRYNRDEDKLLPCIGVGVAESVLDAGEARAENALRKGKARAREVSGPSVCDTTDGLRSQLSTRGNTGIQLSPVGTSVYVRNYRSTGRVAAKSGGIK